MALSVWEYIRRRTADAVLAGCHDALDMMETQDQGATMWAAAKALRKQLNEAQTRIAPANGGNGGNGGNGSPAPPTTHNHAPPTPVRAASPTPMPNSAAKLPAPLSPQYSTSAPTTPVAPTAERRKVGRPRKEVYG